MSVYRDATNILQGFMYQGKYAQMLFLENLGAGAKIIEEGKIDGRAYEDITILREGLIITYQIKYQSTKIGISPSSSIYTSLANCAADKLVFVAHCKTGGSPFSREIHNWNDYEGTLRCMESQVRRVVAPRVGEPKQPAFEQFISSSNKLEILKRCEFVEGKTYAEINKTIQNLIGLDNWEVIAYKISELFANHMMNSPRIPMDIDLEYLRIVQLANNDDGAEMRLKQREHILNSPYDDTMVDLLEEFANKDLSDNYNLESAIILYERVKNNKHKTSVIGKIVKALIDMHFEKKNDLDYKFVCSVSSFLRDSDKKTHIRANKYIIDLLPNIKG